MALAVKNLPTNSRDAADLGAIPGAGKIPWSRKWQTAPVFLPGKFHGQRSLEGYSPWGHKELDMTEQRPTQCILSAESEATCLIH